MSGTAEYRAEFTLDDVIEKVREVAAANPHHIYERPVVTATASRRKIRGSCAYTHENADTGELTPGCLIGQALIALGVPMDYLHHNCQGAGVESVLKQIGIIEDVPFASVPEDVWRKRTWLSSAQNEQDSGHEWGTCVIRADRFFK